MKKDSNKEIEISEKKIDWTKHCTFMRIKSMILKKVGFFRQKKYGIMNSPK